MHLVLKFWFGGRFVAEKQTYVLNLMAGHLLNMTYNENGKWNVWELDHYTDRSSLGIHFWDLHWKMAYLKFENFWYSNVRPWETVQIWGDCPFCVTRWWYCNNRGNFSASSFGSKARPVSLNDVKKTSIKLMSSSESDVRLPGSESRPFQYVFQTSKGCCRCHLNNIAMTFMVITYHTERPRLLAGPFEREGRTNKEADYDYARG